MWVDIDALRFWDENPNEGDIGIIYTSIKKHGYYNKIAVWQDNVIMGGNHSVKALLWLRKDYKAGRFGSESEPGGESLKIEGDTWLVEAFDISHMPYNDAVAFGLALNNATRQGRDDPEKLAALLERLNNESAELLQSTGFTPENLQELIEVSGGEAGAMPAKTGSSQDPTTALQRAEQAAEIWQPQTGALYKISYGDLDHYLYCGDIAADGALDNLLRGASPDLLHTDPPYGINAVSEKRGAAGLDSVASSERKQVFSGFGATSNPGGIVASNVYPVIHGDDAPFDPSAWLYAAPVVVLWGANYYAAHLPPSAGWLVWDKREGITRNSFADCEMAWTNQDRPARLFAHLWNGLHKGSEHGQARAHPTQKPVALFRYVALEYAPEARVWLEPFAGSGAQILAATALACQCYAAEIELLYCASILERCKGQGHTIERLD